MSDATHALITSARARLTRAVKSGAIVPQPCIVCGEERSEAHHDCYEEPLRVRWFCHRHHMQYHADAKMVQRNCPGGGEMNDDHETVMTPAQFAERAGVSRTTVYNWMDRGDIEYSIRPGGRRWIPERELAKVGNRKAK